MNDERFELWLDSDFQRDGAPGDGDADADATLDARRSLQARIDASLRARFSAPRADELARLAVAARARPWQGERGAWLALAATLLLALGIGTWNTRTHFELQRSVAQCMLDAYRATDSARATEACGDLESDWVRSKMQRSALGCTVVAPGEAAHTHTCVIEGQAPTAGTPFTSCVRAQVDGKRVLLWAAALDADPKPSIDPACGLVVYRGLLDGRVLYEYTPLHEPVLLQEIGALIVP